MTILEAITRADQIRPNELAPAVKLRWLSTLDGQLDRELLDAYEAAGDGGRGSFDFAPLRAGRRGREAADDGAAPFRGYDGETEIGTTELLIPWPYDELYVRYLLMRIDLEHGELDRYNNEAAQFNRLWQSCAAWHCRNHLPKGVSGLRF